MSKQQNKNIFMTFVVTVGTEKLNPVILYHFNRKGLFSLEDAINHYCANECRTLAPALEAFAQWLRSKDITGNQAHLANCWILNLFTYDSAGFYINN